MSYVWPVPRSTLSPVPHFRDAEIFGGASAAADLVRLGVLAPLFDGGYCLETNQTPHVRAHVIAPYVSGGAVVGMESAAWIYTGIGRMRKVFLWQSRAKHRLPPHRRRIVRSREVPAEDIIAIAGVPVTSVRRTLVDLQEADNTDQGLLDALRVVREVGVFGPSDAVDIEDAVNFADSR